MKYTILSLTALAFSSFGLNAQLLEVNPSTVDFGYVTVGQPDSVQIALYNPTATPYEVDFHANRMIYSDDAFRVSPAVVTVPSQDSAHVWLVFNPFHNVEYDGDIVLSSPTPAGACAIDVEGHGRFANSYYNATENLSEEALKAALQTLLAQNFNSYSYDNARDQMYGNLDNVGGVVECVYTGRTATFSDRPGANANSFNCEHTFPQGFFNSAQPMRGDIHHLYPTDASVNSRRSNHPFGVVANPTWTGGGSKYGNSTFEPRDQHKGTAARAMMYFVIRYQDYSNFFAPQESILRQWHNAFPPQTAEQTRNNDIYQLQNNRNPFVDYPQFEERINSFVSTSTADLNFELTLGNDTAVLAKSTGSAARMSVYQTYVVNTGNQPLFIQLQALPNAGSGLAYDANQTMTQNLLPGEGMSITLNYATDLMLDTVSNPVISMNTNLPAGMVEIPMVMEEFALSTVDNAPVHVDAPFPNPTNGLLYLDGRVEKVTVFNALGQVVLEAAEATVDMSGLNPGIYWVNYNVGNTEYTEKIIVGK